MSKILSLIRRAPKRFTAIVAMVAAAIIVPAMLNAWGPNRPTFTYENPAPYVTFNSITNNPKIGDERNFVRIREDGAGNYTDSVTLQPGKVYQVSVYYHNNASSSLNDSGKGIALNTKLRMELPGVVKPGVNAAFSGNISASNANPGTVWDEAYGKNATGGDIALRYVANSAVVTSNGAVNGKTLPETLFTTGTNLGYNALDGKLPGCNEFAGYVTFKFRVDQPNFTVDKKVSVDGGKTWVKSAKTTPGATIQYAISYQNTGTSRQDNVSVRDMLPANVSYVPNSTQILNSVTGGQFKPTVEGITTNGLNAGSYEPKGNVFYKFSAKVADKASLACGTNALKNTVRITTTGGYKEDDATVTVDKDCPPTPIYTCSGLTVNKVDRTNFKFKTSWMTTSGASFKSITYTIKNASGAVVDTKTVNGSTDLDYSQTTPGKYTVETTLVFTVNGETKLVTSANCTGSFEVEQPPVKDITVCDLTTKKIITIKEDQFDPKKHSKNLEDCKEAPKKPGVSIEKTVNGKKNVEVKVNTPYNYELTVKNTGEVDLTNVKVTDPAPANVEFISASAGTIVNNKWEYTIPSLKIGESKKFTITAKVTKEVSGAIKNTACVDAPAVPGTPDDCDDATVTVPPTPTDKPGVSIEKTVNGKETEQVKVNTPFEYRLTVKNTGNVDLTKVKVSDPAPANVEFIKASVGTINGNKWEYTIDSLKVGESKTFTITAKVTKEVSGAIKNTACVDAPAVPGTPDDCDDATIVVPPADEIAVCDLGTKEIVTIKEADFDANKHSKNFDDCKKTPTTPVTPPELPTTGATDGIVAFLGLGAIIASVGYYIASRRALGL